MTFFAFNLQCLVDEPVRYEPTSSDETDSDDDSHEKENHRVENNAKSKSVSVRTTLNNGKKARFSIPFKGGFYDFSYLSSS